MARLTAEREVQFRNFGPVTLTYTLVKEHRSWKVDDIANQQGNIRGVCGRC